MTYTTDAPAGRGNRCHLEPSGRLGHHYNRHGNDNSLNIDQHHLSQGRPNYCHHDVNQPTLTNRQLVLRIAGRGYCYRRCYYYYYFILLISVCLLSYELSHGLPLDDQISWPTQQQDQGNQSKWDQGEAVAPQADNSRGDQLEFDAITNNKNSDASFADELESANGVGGSSLVSSSSPLQVVADLTSSFESTSDLIKLSADLLANATTMNSVSSNGTRATSNAADVAGWASKSLLQKIIIVADTIIFVVGFIGNTVVILVILKFTKTESVTDIYIGNLAMADLMFITGLPVLTTTMIVEDWIFGFIPCRLYMAATSLNQFASSLLLVVMSFDRYLAVCHPIYAQRFRQTRGAKTICLSIWIICLLLMSPIFLFAKVARSDNDHYTCAISWPEYTGFNCEIAFTVYSFIIGFAGPILLIAGFYWRVIRKLRNAASGPIGSGSSKRSKRETANRRIEHLVIGIIMTYTLCWLPYQIFQLILSFSGPLPFIFYELFWIATSLSYTNSALNPMLYAFLSDNFRSRCSEVFHSIYKLSWCSKPGGCATSHHTATTACYESEMSRPESRHDNTRFLPSDSLKCHSPSATEGHRLFELNHHNGNKNSNQMGTITTATTPLDTNIINNSNKLPDSSPANDASGSVYCGDRKRSVAFVVVQDGGEGEVGVPNIDNNGITTTYHNSQSNDRCQNV